ncbi:carbohydrate-binding protein [Streptacidiphilus sp. PB12-B1b]|uniref:beta-1,3-glucanase family protein n=1 Tax=Streptacidiphilus sp. PB12-B1b TaxID=2705012 RepID=UPI0015F7F364|nr:beta-1,3-glucanase family protein [Streptacidiphilus sp. PB12-B1b]QMU77752.1 carbohydrate-binding protein [Streptacidiphilus sp. PB12-B1b]
MLSRRKFVAASAAALAAPAVIATVVSRASANTGTTLSIDLKNTTGSDTVYAYVTGNALDQGSALMLLQADGRTPYYPSSPSSTGSPLTVNCAIPLGPSGSGPTRITVPHIGGGRIWFSVGAPITFLLNPGPALVEPSVTNPSDPNIHTLWDFCEFTFSSAELYANISFVDFVSLPIGLQLTSSDGSQSAPGLPAGGLDTVCAALNAQAAADGQGWNQLVVTSGSKNLRALSPTNGIINNPSLLSGYFDGYLEQVWQKYTGSPLTIDTQASWGKVTGQVSGGVLNFPGIGSFGKPSSADVFSCDTGPFNVSGSEMGAIAARLSAAINRTTLLIDSDQPDGENPAQYYTYPQTNHYARILHAVSLDGRGYAFPYDDVQPDGGVDQSGAVVDGNPTLLTITVGPANGGSTTPPTAPPTSGPTATPTPTGGTVSAYGTIQAESYSSQSGTSTETTTDSGGGKDVGSIGNGDWLGYAGVDFGSTGATQFQARVASGAAAGVSGLVQVRLDSVTGPVLGSFAVGSTGGWQSWSTVPANISRATGVHTVYLTFSSGQPADFVNVNWFTFKTS